MRIVSLNARTASDAENSGEVEAVLFAFHHAALDAPIRISTDPTERLSSDPLSYGTRSTWDGADPSSEPFLYAGVSAEQPSDIEDAPAEARIIVEMVTRDIASSLMTISGRARVHMAVVLATSPNVIEVEYRNLMLVSAEGDTSALSLALSRIPIEDELVPGVRFTKDRFPGLFR